MRYRRHPHGQEPYRQKFPNFFPYSALPRGGENVSDGWRTVHVIPRSDSEKVPGTFSR